MSAVINHHIKELMELKTASEMAKVLWELDRDNFDYFQKGGKFFFEEPQRGLDNDTITFKHWAKLISSMDSYAKVRKSMEIFPKARTLIEVLGSLDQEIIHSIIDGSLEEIAYFCMIFNHFLESFFPSFWREVDSRMNTNLRRSYEQYLAEVMQGNYQTSSATSKKRKRSSAKQSTNSRSSAGGFSCQYELTEIIDKKQSVIYKMIEDKKEDEEMIRKLKSDNKALKRRYEMHVDMANDKNNEIRHLENRVRALQKLREEEMADPKLDPQFRLSFERLSTEREVLQRENKELREQVVHLKGQISEKELQMNDLTTKFILRSEKSGSLYEAKSQERRDLRDQCSVNENRIEILQARIKDLQDKLVRSQKTTEDLHRLMDENLKDLAERERMIVKIKDQLRHFETQNKRLTDDLEDYRQKGLKMEQSHLRLKLETSKKSKKEEIMRRNEVNEISIEDKSRLNMTKTLEEVALYYTEELRCLYSLMHDVFVNELTGESLQDLVNKKVFENDLKNHRRVKRANPGLLQRH